MRVLLAAVMLIAMFLSSGLATAQDEPKKDARLGPPREYKLDYFPWAPPKTLKDWEAEKKRVQEKVLVSQGLWPMPDKTNPFNAVIHGKIERDGYTIEKVSFESYPGFYVTGSLYRPTGKTGRLPAVLCPHGHWANGRFFEAGDKEVENQMKPNKDGIAGEKTKEGAKYPLQARCAMLARLGCVVFHYDMVGVADSTQIGHRQGFLDVEAELRLQNFMGLQTYNSIRALDWLISQPYVDPGRIGVTGASGGGTQTFMLCSIDDRPAAAFPAVMVGTAMQGGCICENCSYLRIDGNNVQLAACFAPRPQAMSCANDWTVDFLKSGLPELKDIYGLYKSADKVDGQHWNFDHNYNQVSREMMYNFFNKHLKLGHKEPIIEQPFVPVPPKELSVYDAEHPRPKNAVNAEGLRRYLTEASDKQMKALLPKGKESLRQFREVMEPGLRVMMTDSLPTIGDIDFLPGAPDSPKGRQLLVVSRKGRGEKVLLELFDRADVAQDSEDVIWVHPDGRKSTESPAFKKLLEKKNVTVWVVEPFRTGAMAEEKSTPVNKGFAGYTFGYNRPLVAERVHDILTAIAVAKGQKATKSIRVVGFGNAGPWVALARGLCGDAVARTAVDANGFHFESVKAMNDEMMLPGALKYGGLMALTAVSAPYELLIHNTKGCGPATYLDAAYEAAGASKNLVRREEAMDPAAVVDWLLR